MKRFIALILSLVAFSPFTFRGVSAMEAVTSPEKSDFETRREVLLKIFNLSESEIFDLQSRLEKVSQPTDITFRLIHETLKQNLDSYLDLIASRTKELSSPTLTLDGVRKTADNFKQWRETVYNPSTKELFDFLILMQSDVIFSIVEPRYANVVSDIERLRLSFPGETIVSLDALLVQANKKLVDARLFRDRAKSLFVEEFLKRHGDLSSKFARATEKDSALTASAVDTLKGSSVDTKEETVLDTLDMSRETVQSLTRRAVNEVSEIYKLFLQMRELVRNQ